VYWRVTTRSPRGQFSGRAPVVRCDGLVVSPTQSATDAETSEDSGPEERYPGRSRTTTWQRNLAIDGGANVLEGMPTTPIQTCKLDLPLDEGHRDAAALAAAGAGAAFTPP
jgi:hypothetical protein